MRRSAGYSLTEVMIALGLSGLVMAGAFAIMSSQRQTYQTQNALARRQQELWVAMEFVQRDVRRAGMGFGMCQHTVGTTVYHASVDCYPAASSGLKELRPITFSDGGTTGPDTLNIFFTQPPSNGVPDGQTAADIASRWTGTSLTLASAARAFMSPVGCCSGGPACSALPSGSLALLYNRGTPSNACTLVEITGASCTSSTLSIQPRPSLTTLPAGTCSAPAGGWTDPPATTYAAGTDVLNLGLLQRVSYSIDGSDPKNPKLVRNLNGTNQVIAYGIEDLQIVPACDVNGSGLVEPEPPLASARATDEWFNNVNGDTVPASCTNFPFVRVSMVARLPNAAPGLEGQGRPGLENRAAGAVDMVRRRVMTVIASAPNLGL